MPFTPNFEHQLPIPARINGSAPHPPNHGTIVALAKPLLALSLLLLLAMWSSHAAALAPALKPKWAIPNLAIFYDEIAPKLISGGAFVYVVPFSTVGDIDAQNPEMWRDCTGKVLVSATGLEQARLVNSALKSLPVTISYGQTGDSCWAMSSLRYLLSGIGAVLVTTNDFDPYEILRTRGTKDAVLASLIQAQFTHGQSNATKLMVGARMAKQVAPHPVLADLAPGESAIFVESGTDYPTLLARLTPHQWAEMAQYWRNRSASTSTVVPKARPKKR